MQGFITALSAGLAVAIALGCATDRQTPEVEAAAASLRHLPAGSVIGNQGQYGGYQWRGIPYAQAPEGDRRYREPAPLDPWQGTHEALSFGASCPQFGSSTGGDATAPDGELAGSEDCLFLNVYAPAKSATSSGGKRKPLPVMFWIHGGGNVNGATTFYDGSRLATEQGVVVVTVNYRLGFLGWFAHPALRADATAAGASGNFGTLDLIRALEWLQENVGAFGGDPGNVTIFGESAGGWNVVSLLASPLANGKFHRAIVQSGLTWSRTHARAENYTDAEIPGEDFSSGDTIINLMLQDDTASDRASAKRVIASMNDTAIASYLRGKSVGELFHAYDPEGTSNFECPRMFEDGTVLPTGPLAHAFRTGKTFNRVPVMLGSNKDEEKLFLLFEPKYTRQLFGIIPLVRDLDRYLRDADTITRIWRVMAVDELAQDLALAMPGEVFSYRFDWDEEPKILWFDLGEIIGAAHGFEIPFVFGHWDLGPDTSMLFNESNRSGREALSESIRSYWSEFALRGHPGKGRDGRLPHWAAWTEGASRFAILDTEHEGGLIMSEGHETAQGIADGILVDTTYSNTQRRCRALAAIYDWAPLAFTVEDYAQAGRGVCREYPIQEILESI